MQTNVIRNKMQICKCKCDKRKHTTMQTNMKYNYKYEGHMYITLLYTL